MEIILLRYTYQKSAFISVNRWLKSYLQQRSVAELGLRGPRGNWIKKLITIPIESSLPPTPEAFTQGKTPPAPPAEQNKNQTLPAPEPSQEPSNSEELMRQIRENFDLDLSRFQENTDNEMKNLQTPLEPKFHDANKGMDGPEI